MRTNIGGMSASRDTRRRSISRRHVINRFVVPNSLEGISDGTAAAASMARTHPTAPTVMAASARAGAATPSKTRNWNRSKSGIGGGRKDKG